MMTDRPRCRPKDMCIMCDSDPGTIRTSEGMVCERCMPRELLPRASVLRRRDIAVFMKSHPGAPSCFDDGDTCREGGTVSPDRSMAITLSDGIVLADELNAQIRTADSIDMVVSFILMSGLNLIIDSLREFTKRGKLRVITTAYMGTTEYEAVEQIVRLPNTELRMELDSERNRLHAKSFIFYRAGGHGTAYVGSANISKSALTSGEEWVVKVREEDVPLVIDDLRKGYDAIWRSGHVKRISLSDRAEVESALEKRGRS